MRNILPDDDAERGEILLATCLLDYFPNACIAVAKHSKASNEKHNPGCSPRWDRSKSTDHRNKILRHLLDIDGEVAVAWRALAMLEDKLIAAGAVPGRNAIGSPSRSEVHS